MRKLLPIASILWLLILYVRPPQTWANLSAFTSFSVAHLQKPPVISIIVVSTLSLHVTLTPTAVRSRISTPTPTQVLTPTLTLTPTIRPTPIPTQVLAKIPTATAIIKLTPAPTGSQASSSVQDYIMNEINKYRLSKGLSSVQKDQYTCGFAKTRAAEISVAFNHDGFTNRINNHTLSYPSYSIITENIAQTSNYKDVVNLWINSSGHAANIQKDTPYVCVEQNGNNYAYEGWKP